MLILFRYNNETHFAMCVKMIVALAFVPPPNVQEYASALAEFLPDEVLPLLNWFQNYYIGGKLLSQSEHFIKCAVYIQF